MATTLAQHAEYRSAYHVHQGLLAELKKSRQATNELERQVEQSQMRLTRAQRLLLEEAQQV